MGYCSPSTQYQQHYINFFPNLQAVTQHIQNPTLSFSSVDLSYSSLAEIQKEQRNNNLEKFTKKAQHSCNHRNIGRPKGFILLRPMGKSVLYLCM